MSPISIANAAYSPVVSIARSSWRHLHSREQCACHCTTCSPWHAWRRRHALGPRQSSSQSRHAVQSAVAHLYGIAVPESREQRSAHAATRDRLQLPGSRRCTIRSRQQAHQDSAAISLGSLGEDQILSLDTGMHMYTCTHTCVVVVAKYGTLLLSLTPPIAQGPKPLNTFWRERKLVIVGQEGVGKVLYTN